jgi:hypothetical protein
MQAQADQSGLSFICDGAIRQQAVVEKLGGAVGKNLTGNGLSRQFARERHIAQSGVAFDEMLGILRTKRMG